MPGGCDALVIGAGPAGLMAADALASAGQRVLLAEAMPSIGRKLLMAGKSGLNLTMDRPLPAFLPAYGAAAPFLEPMLAQFGPAQVQGWARSLGQPVFTGSSGRVFPVAMKASPLLRAWAARLAGLGVEARTRWRWRGWNAGGAALFDTPSGPRALHPGVTVLALGGASWARLGSDGAWAPLLAAQGVTLAPFRPANMGFGVAWSAHMARHFGAPVKGTVLCAGPRRVQAEFVITARGIEGGGVYAVSALLRDGAPLVLDLLPGRDAGWIAARLARPGRDSLSNRLRKALGLSPVRSALLHECARPLPASAGALAALIKALPLPITGPHPIDEAISTAGGIALSALTPDLHLRVRPGVLACGEMLDWEAPTGGYLLTACLATGLWAGRAAARHLAGTGAVRPGA